MLHIDIETRSPVNLKKQGAYVYAKHPKTELICLCYATDTDPTIRQWVPGHPVPHDLLQALEDPEIWAHNASFERLMFEHCLSRKYDLPWPRLWQWRCTAVLARSFGLPSSLEDVGRCLNLHAGLRKNKRGEQLIRKMSTPPYEEGPQLLREMIQYCAQDVVTERAIHDVLMRWSGESPWHKNNLWPAYQVSEQINDTGLMVDVPFAELAAGFAEREKLYIRDLFKKHTGFNSPTSRKFTEALFEELLHSNPTAAALMEIGDKVSLAKDVVQALLHEELTDDQETALTLKQQYSRSSSSKFQTMVDRADANDDRVRGAYLFLGAARTGRYSSRGLQMHNMPRDTLPDSTPYINEALRTAGANLELDKLPALLRPAVVARSGHSFVCGDWSGIEARALPWLTQSLQDLEEVEWLMQKFQDEFDLYIEAAKGIYKTEHVDSTKRQIGKVAVLSLGYGGSVGAFRAMAKGYNLPPMPEKKIKEIVHAWRRANHWAVLFWRRLEGAALWACDKPGHRFVAPRDGLGLGDRWNPTNAEVQGSDYGAMVVYQKRGENLYCELPNGRELCYLDAEIAPQRDKFGNRYITCIKSSLKPPAEPVDVPWPRERLWGGLQAENVTQAVCADLLMEKLAQLDNVVGHTHDEILLEVPENQVAEARTTLEQVMRTPPAWADKREGWFKYSLRLDVSLWDGEFYRK